MASFAEVARFDRRRPDVDLQKGGIYALQPHIIAPPAPIKIGYSDNLIARMAQYHQSYPFGFDILALARANRRNPAFIRDRSDAVLAEDMMKRALVDARAHGTEWMRGDRKEEVLSAFREAHKKYAGDGPLATKIYSGADMRHHATAPSEKRLRGKQPPPAPNRAPARRSAPETAVEPSPALSKAPKVRARRNQLSQKELERGIRGAHGGYTKEQMVTRDRYN